jgi:hypothetical protein
LLLKLLCKAWCPDSLTSPQLVLGPLKLLITAAAAGRTSPSMEEQQSLDPKFLPFIRTDRYGEGGWLVPFWAKARLILLACTLLPLRLAACLACVASFYVTCRLATLIPSELVARRVITGCGKVWSRVCLFCLGFVYIRWTRPGTTGKLSRAAKRRSGGFC